MTDSARTYSELIQKTLDFVKDNIDADVTSLALNRQKWPDIDMELAINCIESRRKLKGKIREWHENPNLTFPLKLSAEQCSGSSAGKYKSILADRICNKKEWKLADLTGGLGVDSWYFSQKASAILYCEMKQELCKAAEHNFRSLGALNIKVMNICIESEQIPRENRAENSATAEMILGKFSPDIVYIDPARRSETGKKVFLIEECSPDVLTLKDEIFRYSPHILIKLSPMADVTMACNRLGRQCREVHIVSVNDECKELLIWMDKEWNGGYTITAAEAGKLSDTTGVAPCKDTLALTFRPEEEREAAAAYISKTEIDWYMSENGKTAYIFEPGKALLKAGGFNILSEKTKMSKLGTSTHYYIGNESPSGEIASLGKLFKIIRMTKADKKSLIQAGKDFPGADVTARNLPADTETFKKKMKISPKGTSGLNKHIFILKSDSAGALLIVGEKILNSDVKDEEGQAQL